MHVEAYIERSDKYFKHSKPGLGRMIKEKIKVNSRSYNISLNEQTQMYAMKLRRLYQQSYSDMDSFDEVSSEISSTISNLLKHAASPEVREDDMDGVIQQILKIYEKSMKK
jgi:hypothetical protein